MDEIRAWLNSKAKEYQSGVELYVKYGRDRILMAVFTKEAETEFKRNRLQQALKDLLQPNATGSTYAIPVKPGCRPAIHTTDIPRKVNFSQAHKGWPNPITDPVVQALYDQFRPLYAELMNLSSRLYDVAKEGQTYGNGNKQLEACQMVHRIMDVDDQLDDFYRKRDHYLKHGHLPGDTSPAVVGDPVRWATERQNALRYIRDYKGKLRKSPQNKLAPTWLQKIMDWEKLVAHYNKLLKLDE